MTTQWLLGWWNLIFVLPFLLALAYLGLYTVSGITFGDADADADFDADADVDADLGHDVNPGVDLDADHDVQVDHDVEAGSELAHHGHGHVDAQLTDDPDVHPPVSRDVPFIVALLGWLGLGKVPLSVLLMFLFMTWGVIGFITNNAFAPSVDAAWKVAAFSLPVAAAGSILSTRILVRLMVRFVPLNETTARRRHALLGLTGEALYPIDQRFGVAVLRDERGELFQVPCRVADNGATLAKGSNVKLVAYNAKQKMFIVIAADSSRPVAVA